MLAAGLAISQVQLRGNLLARFLRWGVLGLVADRQDA